MFAIDIHCCMAGFQCSTKKWCQCPDDIARGVQGTPFFSSCLMGTPYLFRDSNLMSVTPSLRRWTFPWWSMTVRQNSVFKPSTLRSLRMTSCWKLTSWTFCRMALHRIPMAQSTALSWEFDIPLFGCCSATCDQILILVDVQCFLQGYEGFWYRATTHQKSNMDYDQVYCTIEVLSLGICLEINNTVYFVVQLIESI
jgi:hypothetical protein